jgi:catechol 2,3-dioxygenase-like lactoylglutathione lyase family enzyme
MALKLSTGLPTDIGVMEVGLVTANVAAMLTFYRDFLRLPFIKALPFSGGCSYRFRVGNGVFKIITLEGNPTLTPTAGGGLAGGVAGIRIISLGADNLVDVVNSAERAGYKVAVPITFATALFSYAFLEDPDGNWVEVFGPGAEEPA